MLRLSVIWGTILLVSLSTYAADETDYSCDSATMVSSEFKIAFQNLASYDYVRHVYETVKAQNPGSKVCVRGWPLSKNTYAYSQFLMTVEILSPEGNLVSHSTVLYQDASVQATHNLGGKPWVGVENAVVSNLLVNLHEKLTSTNASKALILEEGQTVRSRLMQLVDDTSGDKADKSTFHLAEIPGLKNVDQTNYLVVWYEKLRTNNPSAELPQYHAYWVSESNGSLALYKVALVTEVAAPLSEVVDNMSKKLTSTEDQEARFLRISLPRRR